MTPLLNAKGQSICITSVEDLMEYCSRPEFRLFGMDRATMLELRYSYYAAGGVEPISVESVRSLYEHR